MASAGYLKLVLMKMAWLVPEMLILSVLTAEIPSCNILIHVILEVAHVYFIMNNC